MEYINKIELCGIVGNVRIISATGKLARFSLCVSNIYRTPEGDCTVDDTWFNCSAWEGKAIKDVTTIISKKTAHIIGHVTTKRYLSASENEFTTWEVICDSVEIQD